MPRRNWFYDRSLSIRLFFYWIKLDIPWAILLEIYLLLRHFSNDLPLSSEDPHLLREGWLEVSLEACFDLFLSFFNSLSSGVQAREGLLLEIIWEHILQLHHPKHLQRYFWEDGPEIYWTFSEKALLRQDEVWAFSSCCQCWTIL